MGGGTAVLRVTATDRDIGPNAMLSYYITGGNQDLTFRMDRMTGEIVTRPSPPDREKQQWYTLTVTVEDDGTPPLSVSVGVCVLAACFSLQSFIKLIFISNLLFVFPDKATWVGGKYDNLHFFSQIPMDQPLHGYSFL